MTFSLLLIFSGCSSPPPPPEPPSGDDEELLELLEYLLEFEDEDGEWVDPQQVTKLKSTGVQACNAETDKFLTRLFVKYTKDEEVRNLSQNT